MAGRRPPPARAATDACPWDHELAPAQQAETQQEHEEDPELREGHGRCEPDRRDVRGEEEIGEVAHREQQRRHVGDEDADQHVGPGRHLEPLHGRHHQGVRMTAVVSHEDDGDGPRAAARSGGDPARSAPTALRAPPGLEQGRQEQKRQEEQQRLLRDQHQRPHLARMDEASRERDGRCTAGPPAGRDAPGSEDDRGERDGEQREGEEGPQVGRVDVARGTPPPLARRLHRLVRTTGLHRPPGLRALLQGTLPMRRPVTELPRAFPPPGVAQEGRAAHRRARLRPRSSRRRGRGHPRRQGTAGSGLRHGPRAGCAPARATSSSPAREGGPRRPEAVRHARLHRRALGATCTPPRRCTATWAGSAAGTWCSPCPTAGPPRSWCGSCPSLRRLARRSSPSPATATHPSPGLGRGARRRRHRRGMLRWGWFPPPARRRCTRCRMPWR